MTEASLYERLGGASPIAAVVDHFSDAVVRNPITGQGSLEISPGIFDELVAELGRSLDHFNAPEKEKGEVLAAFAAHKDEVTEGYSQQY
jgi:hemoglobin